MKESKIKYLSHILIPLLIGGSIYIFFRTKTLLLFNIISFFRIDTFINSIRISPFILEGFFPYWLIYSLPNALWVYSLTAYLLFIWNGDDKNIFWLLVGPLIGIAAEIMQIFGYFPGTYDNIDLLLTIIFGILPFFIFKPFKLKKNEKQKN